MIPLLNTIMKAIYNHNIHKINNKLYNLCSRKVHAISTLALHDMYSAL